MNVFNPSRSPVLYRHHTQSAPQLAPEGPIPHLDLREQQETQASIYEQSTGHITAAANLDEERYLPYDGFYAAEKSRQRWPWQARVMKTTVDITDEVWQRGFLDRLVQIGMPDVVYTQKARLTDVAEVQFVNLASLHRMNMYRIQQKIVKLIPRLQQSASTNISGAPPSTDKSELLWSRAHQLMQDYTTAVRDYDFMKECALRGPDADPFLISTTRALEYRLLKEASLASKTLAPPLDRAHPALPGGFRTAINSQQKIRAFSARLWAALFGGTMLIVPMLIMVLHKEIVTALVTVSVMTFLFAVVLAVALKQPPETLLAAVAAYAAVLVVFVGASGKPV